MLSNQQKIDTQTFTLRQFSLCQQIQKTVQKGDIILSTTDSLPYSGIRYMLGVKYDHLSVFLDSENIIHISWPRVRIIHPISLIARSKSFKIVRPKMDNEELQIFINILKSSLNANYDFMLLIKGVINKLKANNTFLSTPKEVPWNENKIGDIQLQKGQVCTDLIFYALSISSQRFRMIMKDQIQLLDYRIIGSFTTDDLDVLVIQTSFFESVMEEMVTSQDSTFSQKLPSEMVISIAFIIMKANILTLYRLRIFVIVQQDIQILYNDDSEVRHKISLVMEFNLAERFLVMYGLHSLFGLSKFELIKRALFLYLTHKSPIKKNRKAISQLIFHLTELFLHLGKEHKTLKVYRKIAAHFTALGLLCFQMMNNETNQVQLALSDVIGQTKETFLIKLRNKLISKL